MIKIRSHQLAGEINGRKITHEICRDKDSGFFQQGRPDTIVIHYTAGPTLQSATETLKDPEVKASAHLVVDRDGTTCQLINFDRVAWHAGESYWNERKGLNQFSIGIELVNAGELKKSGDSFISWFGKRYSEDEVVEGVHRNASKASFWHAYTPEQINACVKICRALAKSYNVKSILGHEEIAPRRKTDPGPAFPLEELRSQVLETREDESAINDEVSRIAQLAGIARVTARKLNFRERPYASAALAGEPLDLDTKVEVIEESGSWRKVRVYKEGWVHGDYLLKD